MPARISHLTIDAADAYAQSVWWGRVLGFAGDPDQPDGPGDDECVLYAPDGAQVLLFVEVPEPRSGNNRLHLDLRPTDRSRDEEVACLLGHGAVLVADHRGVDGGGGVTLADPEGNEFCVLPPSDRVGP